MRAHSGDKVDGNAKFSHDEDRGADARSHIRRTHHCQINRIQTWRNFRERLLASGRSYVCVEKAFRGNVFGVRTDDEIYFSFFFLLVFQKAALCRLLPHCCHYHSIRTIRVLPSVAEAVSSIESADWCSMYAHSSLYGTFYALLLFVFLHIFYLFSFFAGTH